ncbi:hypothetical protein [Agrobacterium pusense]|uniref:hypothetical protein n=1 Tax=Agrobacterium pusense TaxID=648995 RepID=UPI000D1A530A|nr:hypothetical protein [Agrobacterium pusense]
MPTIADIRQKYPQYQDMSDADLASAIHKKFYSDMPEADFSAKIGLSAPSPSPAAAPVQPEQDTFQRSTILPLGKDTATGEISAAVPGLLKGIYDTAASAVTAPGRAMGGELQVFDQSGHVSPEAIKEGVGFASIFSPASPASTLTKTPVAPSSPPPVALSEGQQAALAAQRLGVDLPRAAASDTTSVQQMGKVLTNVPIGGTPLRNASTRAIQQLDDAAMKAQQAYGKGDVAAAGAGIRQGIKDFSANTLDDLVSKKYDAVDNLVNPKVTAPLSATQNRVNEILAARQQAALPAEGSAAAIVKQAVDRPEGLNYEGVKRLRTEVGQMLKNPQMAPAGTSQDELRAIYGSLSDDLRNVVTKAGGEKAASAFDDANSFAAKTIAEQKNLDKIIGPQSDEGLFSKIQAMAGSTSRADIHNLARVRQAVSPETWNDMSSAVLANMGRDAAGNFSPDRFLTAYGKLSKNGKNLLFRGNGKDDIASSLDDIAAVSARFKQLNQYANPSGTGQAIIGGSYIPGLFVEPASVVSGLVGTRALSNVLARPTTAKKLAAWSKAYEMAATKPSATATNMLGVRAKVLALSIANDNNMSFNDVSRVLSQIHKSPADQGNENGRGEENLQNGEANKLRMLLTNEI